MELKRVGYLLSQNRPSYIVISGLHFYQILWKGPRYTFWHTMLLNVTKPSFLYRYIGPAFLSNSVERSTIYFLTCNAIECHKTCLLISLYRACISIKFCGKVHDILSDIQCYWISQNRPPYIVLSGLHFYQILWKGPRYTFWHTILLNVTKPSSLYRYIGPAFLSNFVKRSTIYFLTYNVIECHKTVLLISFYRACISIKFCEKVQDILSDIQCYWMSQNHPSYIVIPGLYFCQILWKGPRYNFWQTMLLNVIKPSFLYRYIRPAFLSNSVERSTIYFLTYNVTECHKTVLRISCLHFCQILWKGPRYTFLLTMILNVTKPSFSYRYIGPAFYHIL